MKINHNIILTPKEVGNKFLNIIKYTVSVHISLIVLYIAF